jgi:hypothetical protein
MHPGKHPATKPPHPQSSSPCFLSSRIYGTLLLVLLTLAAVPSPSPLLLDDYYQLPASMLSILDMLQVSDLSLVLISICACSITSSCSYSQTFKFSAFLLMRLGEGKVGSALGPVLAGTPTFPHVLCVSLDRPCCPAVCSNTSLGVAVQAFLDVTCSYICRL